MIKRDVPAKRPGVDSFLRTKLLCLKQRMPPISSFTCFSANMNSGIQLRHDIAMHVSNCLCSFNVRESREPYAGSMRARMTRIGSLLSAFARKQTLPLTHSWSAICIPGHATCKPSALQLLHASSHGRCILSAFDA